MYNSYETHIKGHYTTYFFCPDGPFRTWERSFNLQKIQSPQNRGEKKHESPFEIRGSKSYSLRLQNTASMYAK